MERLGDHGGVVASGGRWRLRHDLLPARSADVPLARPAYPSAMATKKKTAKKPEGPSIGVGHDDWPSQNPGMKPLPKKKAPKKG